MSTFPQFLLRARWALLGTFLAAAAWGASRLPGFAIEAGTDVLLDQADKDLAYYNQTRADWNSDEYVIVCCRRKEGWFTPESLALLNDFVRKLRTLPHARKVLTITRVPLLRNQPMMMGLPVGAYLADDQDHLNPKVNLEKAKMELLHHTQALGNLISSDVTDLSILVDLDVPEDIARLEP